MSNNRNTPPSTGTTRTTATGTPGKQYIPDWEQQQEKWDAYARQGGKGFVYSRRHSRTLKATIKKHVKDPAKRKRLFSLISKSHASRLEYMNPSARLLWGTHVMNGFRSLQPKGVLFGVTLISEGFSSSSAAKNPRAWLRVFQAIMKVLLTECGASAFGNIEFAVFPKTTEVDGGYQMFAHFQGLVWNVSKKRLKRRLVRWFPPMDDGTPGAWVAEVTRTVWKLISYNIKAPQYGYRHFPRAGNSPVHNSMEIPLQGHWQLLQQFKGWQWPEFAVAVGEGEKILRGAMRVLRKPLPGHLKSPPADLLAEEADAGPPPGLGVLTIETGVNPAVTADDSPAALGERTADAALAYQEYLGQRQTAKSTLYEFLERTYATAITSASREGELQQLVRLKGLTFNRASDLFSLCLKLAIPTESYDKRRSSEWAAALRYLHSKGCQPGQASRFLQEHGGTKACAKAMANPGDDETKTPISPDEIWKTFETYGKHFEVATNRLEMPVRKGILIAEPNPDNNRLLVHHVIDIRNPTGRAILRKLAASISKINAGGSDEG